MRLLIIRLISPRHEIHIVRRIYTYNLVCKSPWRVLLATIREFGRKFAQITVQYAVETFFPVPAYDSGSDYALHISGQRFVQFSVVVGRFAASKPHIRLLRHSSVHAYHVKHVRTLSSG